jgi:hypothetical protein
MKRLLALTMITTSLALAPAWAADPQDHAAHHPEAAPTKPAATAGQPKSAAKTEDAMAAQRGQMEKQMKSMQEMHAKFMNAKTPEERAALMDDHMKTMQSGMAMMKEMHGGSGKGMSMGMGRRMGMGQGQTCMDKCMQMRMDMMEMMMQMMMDRASFTPGK